MAERFIKWLQGKPAGLAGPVTIGETKDKGGYIATGKAAKDIAVDPRTTWIWTTQKDKAPTHEPLDVIGCTASEQFYILESEVSKLKKLILRSGLRRSRRAQLELHP